MQPSKKTGRKFPTMNNPKKNSSGYSFIFILLMPVSAILFLNFTDLRLPKIRTGTIQINFKNTVSGTPLVLDSGEYTNVFGESYRVSKFKYYISNLSLNNAISQQKEKESYHLVDARDTASLRFSYRVNEGEYNDLFFLLGVDSIKNCSGAQTGALDPMNDMFWTWNNGYVMAKLEGISPVSTAVEQRMEYHIGGYRGRDNVIQKINLSAVKPIIVTEGKITEIIIETDLSKWWQAKNRVAITETPVCSTPGQLAKKIAANYSNMFSIQTITPN